MNDMEEVDEEQLVSLHFLVLVHNPSFLLPL